VGVPVITSARNEKVAAAVRLKKRAFRDEDRRFLVEGAQAVGEAIGARSLERLYHAEDVHPLVVRARESGSELVHVTDDLMQRLTSTVTPQGLVGVSPFLDVGLEALPAAARCVAVLHAVRDPGNAGTVLRSADAAGADGVVFSSESVDVYNPKTVRACAGSVFHLPIVRDVPTAEAVDALRTSGHRILAMDARGSHSLYTTDVSGPVAFVFGNEAHGLPHDLAAAADHRVRIPIHGRAESLNLATAAAVCLYASARAQR